MTVPKSLGIIQRFLLSGGVVPNISAIGSLGKFYIFSILYNLGNFTFVAGFAHTTEKIMTKAVYF